MTSGVLSCPYHCPVDVGAMGFVHCLADLGFMLVVLFAGVSVTSVQVVLEIRLQKSGFGQTFHEKMMKPTYLKPSRFFIYA